MPASDATPEADADADADTGPPAPPAPVAAGVTARPRRGRLPALLTAGFVAIVIAAVVSIVATSGHSKPVAQRSTPTAATSSSAASVPTTTASTSTSATTSTHHRRAHRGHRRPARGRRSARLHARPRLARLAGLPGGLRHVTGSVRLVGRGTHLRLRLRVRGLPRRRHGHYELWLYDSVIDSHPLGRFRVGHRARTYRLPANASRYRSIDLSLQPRGARAHSGESLLRAANPARQARRSGGRGRDSRKDRTGP